MKKRTYLYILTTLLCGFAINLQAAVISLGSEDTPEPLANYVEKTNDGNLSIMGEVVMKSTNCPTGIKSCPSPKIGVLKAGYSFCYAECYCPKDWIPLGSATLDDGCKAEDKCTTDDGTTVYKKECVVNLVDCPSGEQNDKEGGCEECPEGTYKSGTNKNFCTTCTSGETPNGTATGCTSCPKGHYCPTNTTIKTPCPKGTYNNKTSQTTQDACLPCLECKYSTQEGASSCSSCSNGIIDNNNTSCSKVNISCPSGYEYMTGNIAGCSSHATAAVTSANFCDSSSKINTNAKYCKVCTTCYAGYKLINGECQSCTKQSAPSGYPNTTNPGCRSSSTSQKTYADSSCGTGYTTWYSNENCFANETCTNGTCESKDSCSGYYDCGGNWQYCTGNTCPDDSSKCSVSCVSDYFPHSCDSSTCTSKGGIYRNGYCSVSCNNNASCTASFTRNGGYLSGGTPTYIFNVSCTCSSGDYNGTYEYDHTGCWMCDNEYGRCDATCCQPAVEHPSGGYFSKGPEHEICGSFTSNVSACNDSAFEDAVREEL